MSDTYSVIPPPRLRARCEMCLDDGWIEVEDRATGEVTTVPCPEGCADVPP